jgi:hypothetical protein
VVCFTPRPLNPQGKSSRYPLERRRGGHQSLFERLGEWKNLLPLPQSNSGRPAHRASLYPSTFYKVGNIKKITMIVQNDHQKATRSQVRSRGICGGQSSSGAGFLWVLWFPLPILILQTVPCPLIILSSCVVNLHRLAHKSGSC